MFNPVPTGHGRNQPIYECHVTTAGRNRVNFCQKIYLADFDRPKKKHDNLTDTILLFFRREIYDQFEPVYDGDYYNSMEPNYDQTEEPGVLTFDYLKPGIRKK